MMFRQLATKAFSTLFLLLSVFGNAAPLDGSTPQTLGLVSQLNKIAEQSIDLSGKESNNISIQSEFEGDLSWQEQCPHWTIEHSGSGMLLGRITIHLNCGYSKIQRWVPALIKASAHVVVIKTPIRNGDTIPAESLGLESREITWLHGNFFLHIADVAGATARRSLNSGMLVGPNDLAPPMLVRRGDQVMIEAVAGNLTVSDVGIALNDAARGESVRVQHTDTGKIVQGYAIDHDVVRISL